MSQRVAIVTGSAQGIGKAIALRLAADGYDIGLNDIPPKQQQLESLAKEIQNIGRRTAILLADVISDSSVGGMVKQAVDELGSLDVMVSNAGIYRGTPFLETTVGNWDTIQDVNLRGTFLCFKYAAKQMIAQGRGGRIVGACSIAGFTGFPISAAYSASKAGMRALTHSAAREWGRHGINVNCYAPGVIVTDLTKAALTEADLKQSESHAALRCNGTPEDVAGLVSFLVSDNSRFITGQTIIVDGGVTFI